MPTPSNRPRAKKQKSQNPARKRTMRASNLSAPRSSRLKPSARKAVDARPVAQRKSRKRNQRKAQIGLPVAGEITDVETREMYKLKKPIPEVGRDRESERPASIWG